MKLIIAIIVCIFMSIEAGAVVFERVLTEESSIQSAMILNYDILVQSQKIELFNQKSRESRALYFPIVDLNINLSKFNNASPIVVFNGLSASPVYLPAENPENVYYNSRISVWQHIYTGGRIRAANNLALINIEKSKNELVAIKNKVLLDVKSSFNEVLYYKIKLQYWQSVRNRRNPKEIDEKMAETKLGYEKSLLSLLNLIGLDLNTIADLDGSFEPKITNISLDKCIVLSYQYNPEFQNTRYQESSDELSINLLSMQRYPTVDIGALQEWAGKEPLTDKNNWYVFLNVNLPVFDGGALLSRLAQTKISAKQSSIERAKNGEKIRLLIMQSFLEYDFWKQKALQNNTLNKNNQYDENDLEIIRNLNKSYFALEFAIGVQLDKYSE